MKTQNSSSIRQHYTHQAANLLVVVAMLLMSVGMPTGTALAAAPVSLTSFTLSSPAASPTNSDSLVFLATFNQAVVNVDASDFVINDTPFTTATITGVVSLTAATYTITVSGGDLASYEGIIGLDLDAATDIVSSDDASALTIAEPLTDLAYTLDNTSPVLSTTSTETDPTNTSPFTVDFSFSEDVSGFALADLAAAVTNGVASNFVTIDAANYQADITPTISGLVSVSVLASVAQDAAGNNSLADSYSITYDDVNPTVVISSGETDPTNATPFSINIVFSEEVTGLLVSEFMVTNGVASNLATLDNISYTADVTPSADGIVTVDLPMLQAFDLASNGNVTATQFSIEFDSTNPNVVISTSENDPTNAASFSIDIVFDEEVTGFVVGDLVVGNGVASNLQTADNINFTADIAPTAEGTVTVDLPLSSLLDLAGNGNDAAAQFTMVYDITNPTVIISTTVADPTNDSPFSIDIVFDEEVTDFVVGDLTVGNGAASNLQTLDNISFTADITPVTDGNVTVDLAGASLTDLAGNNNDAATQFVILYDITPPTAAVTSAITSPTNDVSFGVTVTWSEPVEAFVLSDIDVTNGSAGTFAGSGADYTFVLTPAGNGPVVVTIPAPAAHDIAGNHNTVEETFSITFDDVHPVPTISNPSAGHLAINFSEAVTGFALTDLVATNATLSNFAGSGSSYTADYAIVAAGTITINLAQDLALDAAGNGNVSASPLEIGLDSTAPSVVSLNRVDATPSKAVQVRYTLVFSESVVNVDAADMRLITTGSLSSVAIGSVSGSGTTYTVTINTGSGSGNIGLELAVGGTNNIQDAAGNLMAATYTGTNLYAIDRVVPSVSSNSLYVVSGSSFNSFTVTFGEDVNDPAGNSETDDVTNPNNFMLVQAGANGFYNTVSCLGGLLSDDTRVTVNGVTFNHSNYTATVNINNGVLLPVGNYRLFICGTTSIVDLVGNAINGGFDTLVDFTIGQQTPQFPPTLPQTGHGTGVSLPVALPAANAYTSTGFTLQIPSLNVNANILGVALENGDWDLDSLGDNIGYISESAAPASAGNSVLTGHVYNWGNIPGPFVNLKNLKVGETVTLTSAGKVFTYVVRSTQVVDDTDFATVFSKETSSWLTLMTCETYNYATAFYSQRRVVKAELLSVK